MVAAPDDRGSSYALRQWSTRLAARPDVTVAVWFLRDYHGRAWPGARVVDDLRRWPVARAADAVGLGRVGDGLRGRRLRAWLGRLAPDVVIFNDGLGKRILDGWGSSPVTVERRNVEPPVDAELEPAEGLVFDAAIVPPDSDSGTSETPTAIVERLFDSESVRSSLDAAALATVRSAAGVPSDVPLIVGWGCDGWVDGPDVFIRVLWAVRQRHGLDVHGLWLAPPELSHEEDRLTAEARRCGVADAYHRSERLDLPARVCGDVVALPHRDPTNPFDVLEVIASGRRVVTFGHGVVGDPAIVTVDYLDVEAMAAGVAEAIATDTAAEADGVRRRLGVDAMLDDIVMLADRNSLA